MKRLCFSFSILISILALLLGGSQTVQAYSDNNELRRQPYSIFADMDDYRYYLQFIEHGVGSQANSLKKDKNLLSFIQQVSDTSSAIRGVYVQNVMEMPVVQQPAGNAGWVSESDNAITQFGMASKYNTTGLLAHNVHAGAAFFDLQKGQTVVVVLGNGQTKSYKIDTIYRFQALQPTNPYSNFVDLETNQQLSATDLFYRVYTGSHHLTFQTCIEQDGNLSWGRLFVLASPLN